VGLGVSALDPALFLSTSSERLCVMVRVVKRVFVFVSLSAAWFAALLFASEWGARRVR